MLARRKRVLSGLLALAMSFSCLNGGLSAGAVQDDSIPVLTEEVSEAEIRLEAEEALSIKETNLTDADQKYKVCEFREVGGASGGKAFMFQPDSDGMWVELSLKSAITAGTYTLCIGSKTSNNRGIYDVSFNGAKVGTVDGYAATGAVMEWTVGTITIPADTEENVFRFDCTGKNPDAVGTANGLIVDYLRLVPAQAPEDFAITLSAGEHGAITSVPESRVPAGGEVELTFTPDEGYWLDTAEINGVLRVPEGSPAVYNVTNVQSDVAAEAAFLPVPDKADGLWVEESAMADADTGTLSTNIMNVSGTANGKGYVNQVREPINETLLFRSPWAEEQATLIVGTKTDGNRGRFKILLNGQEVGTFDGYDTQNAPKAITVGDCALKEGLNEITFQADGMHEGSTNGALVIDYVQFLPPLDGEEQFIYTGGESGYNELDAGLWTNAEAALAGPDGHGGRVSVEAGASAIFSRYENPDMGIPSGETGNYEVWVWHPAGNTNGALARYTIQTGGGMWIKELDQSAGDGWVKLAVITVVGNTSTEIALSAAAGQEDKTLYAGGVKLVRTRTPADPTSTPGGGGSTEPAILVNQTGFDYGKPKRATVVNVPEGSAFYLKDSTTKEVLYQGTVEYMPWSGTLYDNTSSKGEVRSVEGGIIDFSEFNPDIPTECYLECGTAVSFPFMIAKNWMQRVSLPSATDFMEQTRSDYGTDPGWLQIGWRDSHQFSYELPSLVLQYMSNPSYYNNLPYDVWRAEDCMFEDLRVQDEPNIVWLMQFGMERYYDIRFNGDVDPIPDRPHRPPEVSLGENNPWGNNKPGPIYLHGMIKEQMAYVLYIYPQISQWMSKEDYIKYRDFLLDEWDESRCSLQFHQVAGEKHNLFETQTVVGNLKGGFPPGHSIVPNLLMYEIVNRDMQDPELVTDTLQAMDAERFFDAAYNNCAYVLEHFPIDDPQYSKGQRMNEHIVMENMAWFQEMYPDRAPEELLPAIENWAEKMIARSGNLWDVRMAASVAAGDNRDYWTGSAFDQQEVHAFDNNTLNEPGNTSGFQAAALAAARVLDHEPETQARLRELGIAAIDNMFGRNPYGRTYFFSCTRTVQEDGTPDYKDRNTDLIIPGHEQEIEGTDLGWMERDLRMGSGVLAIVRGRIDASPKEWAYPYNPDTPGGYKEGWVTYNTAWNSSIAYSAADEIRIEAQPTADGRSVNITLWAPNNLDYEKQEFVDIDVTDLLTGETGTLRLTEDGVDALTFSGTWTADSDYAEAEFSYGYGLFRRSASAVITGEGFVPVEQIVLESEAVTAPAGETFQIPVAQVLPENATNRNVVWTSADPEAVRVLDNGMLLALKQGAVVELTASCKGSDATATCTVTVGAPLPASLMLEADASQVLTGETTLIQVTKFIMGDGSEQDVPAGTVFRYGVSDLTLATVSEDGLLLAKRPGTVTVWAETELQDRTLRGECQLQLEEISSEKLVFEFEKEIDDGYGLSDNLTTSMGTEVSEQLKGYFDKDTAVVLFKPTEVGAWLQLGGLQLPAGRYAVELGAKKDSVYGYGPYDITLDGEKLTTIDFGDTGEWYTYYPLGEVEFSEAGSHDLRLTALGPKFNCALNCVVFRTMGESYPAVDFSTLKESISQAEALLAAVRAGTDGKNYPENAEEVLVAALQEAYDILAEAEHPATQEEITAGAEALNSVTEEIRAAAEEPTGPAVYAVRIAETEHGTVKVSRRFAYHGQKVTITAEAEEGYALSSVTVTTAAGKEIPVSDGVFTMPYAAVTVKAVFERTGESITGFDDVEPGSWYEEAVDAMVEAGLMQGTGGNLFQPYGTVTRATMWTILARMDGVDTEGGSSWYEKAQAWAVAEGVSDGTNPDAAVTREQIAVMLYRYTGGTAAQSELNFSDSGDISSWAADAMAWAVKEGILTGTPGGKLNPQGTATRAEAAVILQRWTNK
ncbi:S-layer homology domain-containing protein [Pseudoflavonifractor sp.]|jgi:uncharacterized protein YjdB|uniref:S-layer homology domain-containing protein n=1 Tax=Pseudoflavonifractor sp. TaxID=1980281 RepID=UPI003D8D1C76